MHDNYHYLSGEEFFNRFQDRIPEDLQPRIEMALMSEVDKEELYKLQGYADHFSALEDDYDSLKRDYAEAQDLISELELEIDSLKNKLLKTELAGRLI